MLIIWKSISVVFIKHRTAEIWPITFAFYVVKHNRDYMHRINFLVAKIIRNVRPYVRMLDTFRGIYFGPYLS